MSMDNHDGMISTGENSLFFHQSSLEIVTVESSSSKARGTGEGSGEFCLTKYLFHTSQVSLACHNILRHGAYGFTSPPMEGVVRNVITLGQV
jgi:hypothetical protein